MSGQTSRQRILMGCAAMALFAVAAKELMRVMEQRYALAGSKLYGLFKIADWGGILCFAFIHIGICMLPVRKIALVGRDDARLIVR